MSKIDEIFDDVIINTKSVAAAVTKKASGVYDISKHKISAAELRAELNKKLRHLGAMTYKVNTQGANLSEEINQTIEEITCIKENLKSINDHIAESKNSIKCPICGASLPKNSAFCNICGTKLDEFVADDGFDFT